MKPSIYIAGDSTAATKPEDNFPEIGWGQVLPEYFSADINIENHAVNGRSSKSFIDEGRLKIIAEKLKPGDFLFVQFGHNDSKQDPERYTDPATTYKKYLRQYIHTARAAQAIPVLLNSIHRRKFDENNTFMDTHGPYHSAMKETADKEGVTLLDIGDKSRRLITSLGPEKSIKLFLHFGPGINPSYPDGRVDDTHFNQEGASAFARLIAEEIRAKIPQLASYLL